MTKTIYKKLHGELEGHFKAEYRDDQIAVVLYADNLEELYRAVRFLKLRHLDKTAISVILADTHGEG